MTGRTTGRSTGRIAVIVILLSAALAGAGVWYAQTRGFYSRLAPEQVAAQITLAAADGTLSVLPVASAEGIDATSSPIRWRGCFTGARLPADAALVPYPNPTPLVGPGWFPCYDAGAATEALATGQARALLSAPDVRPDVDRVIVLWPDGHGMAWHQYSDKTPARGVMD